MRKTRLLGFALLAASAAYFAFKIKKCKEYDKHWVPDERDFDFINEPEKTKHIMMTSGLDGIMNRRDPEENGAFEFLYNYACKEQCLTAEEKEKYSAYIANFPTASEVNNK